MGLKQVATACLLSGLTGMAGLAGTAEAASSVDESLDEIAGQIVERTRTDGTATIGISTFTHSDGTCSDLSNYVSEFVVDSLFNAGEGKIDIIERSQLSAIFREMELVFDGTIAPDAAKRLGEIEGVDALVTGSLIQFGEQVKVQARMIGTQDGRLFATARSEFPSVGSVAEMMAKRSRTACGFSETADGAEAAPTTQVVVVEGGGQPSGQGQSLVEPSRRYASDVYDAEVSTLVYSKSSGDTTFAMRFKKHDGENDRACLYAEIDIRRGWPWRLPDTLKQLVWPEDCATAKAPCNTAIRAIRNMRPCCPPGKRRSSTFRCGR